jgi:hypothetical protein
MKGRTRPILAGISFALAVGLCVPASAAPVITLLGYYTDRYAPNSVPNFATAITSNHVQWDVQLISSDPSNLVSVIATRPPNVQFSLFVQGSPIFSNYLFSPRSVPFTEQGLLAFAASLPPWGFTATDTTGSTSGQFPTIADPELLPFAFDIEVSDSSRTPTVSWSLPDLTAFDVDRVRLRAIDAISGLQVFQIALSATATSFTLPDSALTFGHSHFYRVMIEDLNNGSMENRSNAFSLVATTVPEPGSLALAALILGAAIIGLRRRR